MTRATTDVSSYVRLDGNTEIISYSLLAPLPSALQSIPPQSHEAALSFVTLLSHAIPNTEGSYAPEAHERFLDLFHGRTLVANVDSRDARTGALSLTIFDPEDSGGGNVGKSLNVQMVREGWARVDGKSRLRGAYPEVVSVLESAVREAKRMRAGAYELGDIFDD